MRDVQLPVRIMLTGGMFCPPVFDIVATLGVTETGNMIAKGLEVFK